MTKHDINQRAAIFLARVMAKQFPELDWETLLNHAQAGICEVYYGLSQEANLQRSGAFTKDLTFLYRVDLL